MKKRTLESWEKEECAALKAAIDTFNRGKPRGERITQERAAAELSMNQGSFSNYLNGRSALNVEFASGVSRVFGIPVSAFSPRLAAEIALIAQAAPATSASKPAGPSQATGATQEDVLSVKDRADTLALVASPRSREALAHIAKAADDGLLTEEDLVLLELIAKRIAQQSTQRDGPNKRIAGKIRDAHKTSG